MNVESRLREAADALEAKDAEIERLTLERLQFKKWWGQERERAKRLESENSTLRKALQDIDNG